MSALAADRWVERVLFVRPRADAAQPGPTDRGRARRDKPDPVLGVALLLTGVRCVLRYVVLPVGLPLLGLAPGVAGGISLACDVAAVAIPVTSLRRLWAARHPFRWRYLAGVCAALALIAYLRVSEAVTAAHA